MQETGRLPLGVAILAILIGIFGFFVLIGGLLLLLTVAGVSLGALGVTVVFGMTGIGAAIIVLVVGLVILGTAFGLWNQELWALVLAIIVLLFYAVVEFLGSAWLGLVIVVLLLVYLVAVSSHFD
ncbi:MAG: hypothetical protein ABSA15_04140 [Thermoplasmata archaeon]|jgi:hypothetical protein